MTNRRAEYEFTLDDVFTPRGVAVVGVSATKMSSAEMFAGALKRAGFPAIYPVNPKYEEAMGLRCYPSVADIPGPVDHVIVSIPAAHVLDLLDDCARKRVRSVHFFTAGFGETGEEENAELERQMLVKAKAGGFRIIGPNCVGLYVPKSRLASGLDAPSEPGPIGFMSQSGGHAHNLPSYGAARGLRFSKVVSYGNGLDVDESELLDYFAEDPETEIVAAYIEGVKDGRRFIEALKNTAAVKPVVVYKGGRTEAGRRATLGHTASMGSSTAVFDAICRHARIIQVDDVEEMVDVLTALRFVRPLPRGRGVAVIGAGGGPSVLGSESMEGEGLDVPRLSPEVQGELKQRLPVAGGIFVNPLDTTNMIDPGAISVATRVLGRVPDIDMLVYHLGFHPISAWGLGRLSPELFLKPAIGAMLEAQRETGTPILLALRPPETLHAMEEFLAAQEAFVQAGFPVFHSMRHLARALLRVIRWGHPDSAAESG
jgi:acyl-CoA synthetase (NDP forming)